MAAIASAEPGGVEPVRRLSRPDRRPAVHTHQTIRRCIRTGALLAVVSLMPLARGGRARWWLLLAGGVLTVVGFMLRGAASGMVFLPGLMCLAFAPLVPARAKTDRMRRSELERELGVYSHPAQRRLAIQAMAVHDHRFPVTGRY